VSVDAVITPAANAWSDFGGTSNTKKGRNKNVSALFHVSSHAVAGRLACLSVVPALVIFSVTPRPE
jgi:hypothetical protein